MDLLLLAQDVTWGGWTGDAIHLWELARHLAQRGHAVRVVARGAVGATEAPEGVQVHALRSFVDVAFAVPRRVAVVRALLATVADRRPDLVYSRSFGDPWEGIAVAALGLPIVFEVNGHAIAEREAGRGRPLSAPSRYLARRSARRGFARAEAIVTVTETLRDQLVDEFRVPPGKIRVVQNAVDTELFRPIDASFARQQLGLPLEVPVLLFAGNLAPWQGVEYILRALATLLAVRPESQLLIVGDGQQGPDLRNLVGQLGILDQVRFTGAVPHEHVPLYVSAADVCLGQMARDWRRTGSSAIKIREYLSCERPVVASRIPGVEFLQTEDLGRLVPPEDPKALAHALDRLLADNTWRTKAGPHGRAYVSRHASWSSAVAEVENVCRDAVAT